MKKLLTLSLLCLGLLSGAKAQTCGTTISTYPYLENFDGATAPGWTSGGTNSTWALGTPAKPVINSAASGTKSWVTGLTANYVPNEQSFVESPCFNMSTLVLPIVELKIWWQSEFSLDGAVLQSSIDNGATWQVVGVKGDPNNWYNDNSINGAPGGQPAASAQGWTGRTTTNNGSGGWVTARHALTGLGGQANVKLRIAFGSETALQYDGFAFDDFKIFDTPANDAGVTSITSPLPSVTPLTSQPVMVTMKNFGSSPLTSATLGFSVNGVSQPTASWNGNLAVNTTTAPVTIGNFAFPAGVHTLKAWSKTPNGAIDATPSNDTTSITIYSCNPLNGNYTINKGAGVTATNFTSFTAAAQALSKCGVNGPITFSVAAGSGPYNEKISLGNIAGASATNTITFNGNGNTIISDLTSSADAVIGLNGAKFFRFNNLKIESLATTASGSGVYLAYATNNIFNSCVISHSISFATALMGIQLAVGCSDNTFQNNTINGGYYGVYSFGASANPVVNSQFTGNTLKDQYNYGFNVGYSTNTLIEGNDISRPARVNATTLYGIYISTGATGAIISKNKIHNTHDAASATTGTVYGIYIGAASTTGSEHIVKNNLIYNVNNANGILYALYNSSGSNTYYYHNTVTSDPAITYNTLRGIHFTAASTNVKFVNNIISLPSNAATKHAIYLGSATISLVSNNNDLYVGTTGKIGYYTADQTTLADWKAANTNAYDQNSVSADPMFVSSSNLMPINSTLNNAGQALPAVTDDITGAIRSTTTPDLGAYEFTPAANDAGIVGIVTPLTAVTPGVSQPVQVTLKNFGTATLTSATIGWSINKVAQPNFAWSGSLANQASAPVTIGNYTFPAGTFTLKVWAKNPNAAADPNAVNDTTTLFIYSCAPLAGNYTINKNNPTAGTNFQSIMAAVEQLENCGVSGPVTITVTSGTGPYNEQVEIQNIPNTSATNTLTFEGSGNTVSATPVGKLGVFVLNGAKYVKLNNFVITLDAAAATGWGVQLLNAADYNTISNNIINLPITSVSSNINGIITGSGVGSVGNNASNTKIQNNVINGGYYGIQINGNSGGLNADNNKITGNQLKDTYFYAIYVSNANGTLIEGNDISRPARLNGTTLYNVYLSGGCLNTIVSKNRMHNANDLSSLNTGTLYGVYTSAVATVGNENIIRNNAIYNLNNPGGSVYAFYNLNANGTYYYNNTVVTDSTISYATLRGLYVFGPATNVKFKNNIISFPSVATGTKYAINLSANTIVMESDNNDLYVGSTGNVGYYAGTIAATLTNWKAVNANAFDQASVSANPVFLNIATGNLKPNAAPLDNLGLSLTAVTDDIMGIARHATTPDFGAYEFGVPANDVGITSVSTPNAMGCGLTTTETITVTMKNHGGNPQPAVPVLLLVDGVQVTATPETYNTAPIAPNASATYTFTAKANLATAGNHRIIAKTQLAGDITTNNDADTLDIMNPLVSALPVNFDFETAATGFSSFRQDLRSKSKIQEHIMASTPFVTTSTKGLIMDGVTDATWVVPGVTTDPWTNNLNHFSAIAMCVNPAGGTATDSLWLTFDMKQLFKTANANTNFRVTINGTQVGTTYRPPFDPTNPATPNNWRHIKVDLTAFKNATSVMIGLESSVMQEFSNGTGTANLIDNVTIVRRLVTPTTPTGVNENGLAASVSVYPNPSNGLFKVSLPAGKAFNLEVTDLTGKILQRQKTVGETELKLDNQAKGIYLLKVSGENGSAVRKLIVE